MSIASISARPRRGAFACLAVLCLAFVGVALAQPAAAAGKLRIGPRDGGIYYGANAAHARAFCIQKTQQEVAYYKRSYPAWNVRGFFRVDDEGGLPWKKSYRCRMWVYGDA